MKRDRSIRKWSLDTTRCNGVGCARSLRTPSGLWKQRIPVQILKVLYYQSMLGRESVSDPFFIYISFLPFTGESSKMFGNCSFWCLSMWEGILWLLIWMGWLMQRLLPTWAVEVGFAGRAMLPFFLMSWELFFFFLCWCGSRISCKTGVSEILIKQDWCFGYVENRLGKWIERINHHQAIKDKGKADEGKV